MEFLDNAKIEAWKLIKDKKERFINLIISLSVGAIGFSIIQLIKTKFTCPDLLIGTSCMFWCYCIWTSFRTLEASHDFIILNVSILKMRANKEDKSEELTKLQELESQADGLDTKIAKNLKLIEVFFMIGVIVFIIWAVMIKINLPSQFKIE